MNSKRSGAVRLPLKEPVSLKSEHDPFLYGNIAKRDVIETISRKAISCLSNYEVSPLSYRPSICQRPYSLEEVIITGFRTQSPSHTKPGKYQRHLPASDRLQNRHSFLY